MQNKVSGLSVLFRWNTVKVSSAKTFPRSRSRHASCIHGDYVYIIGGKDGNVSLKDIWRFHIGDAEWEKLDFHGDKLPFLEGHTLLSHKRLLLLFGGSFGNDLSDLWILNPDLLHVRKFHADVGSPQPSSRRQHSAVLHDNVMYIYGGYIDLKGSSAEMWSFHIEEEEWEQVLPRQKSEETIGGRHGHSAVMYGRDMWIFGGACDLTPKADLWYFNLHQQKWIKLKTRFGPPCLIGHSAQVMKDNMVVFGGEREKTMSNDFWIFNFGSLQWSHIQLSSITPSPRMWHSMVTITAATLAKTENSVRTCSLPYLQNKNTLHRSKRPKSSPAYSSARSSKAKGTLNGKTETSTEANRNAKEEFGLVNISGQPSHVKQKLFSSQSVTRPSTLEIIPLKPKNHSDHIPVVMTTPTAKVKEEKSPLLTDRQMSVNSVDSESSLKGTDNPCLSLSNDVINENDGNQTPSLPLSLINYVDSRQENRYVKRNQRPRSKSAKEGNMIPLTTIPSNVIRVKPYSSSQRPRSFGAENEDIVIEDLEFCDNFYSSSSMSNHSFRKLSARNAAISLQGSKQPRGNKNNTEMSDKKSFSRKRSFSDSKSLSLSDIYSKYSDSSPDQRAVGGRASVRCWESPSSEVPTTTQSADDLAVLSNSVSTQSNSMADTSFVTLTSSDSPLKPKLSSSQMSEEDEREKLFIAKQMPQTEIPKKKVQEEKPQTITPYLLLFGGKEVKGSNLRMEPISIWKCDVLIRHSDISHGEYHKSSLII